MLNMWRIKPGMKYLYRFVERTHAKQARCLAGADPWFTVLSLTGWLFLATSCTSTRPLNPAASADAKRAIVQVLTTQTAAWNRGDLPGYMQGYWQSDSLVFIGKKGLTYGWQPTLANYQKSYPDQAAMGQLDFSGLRVTLLGAEAAQVVGRWHLARTGGLADLQGHYLLVLRKVRGQWVIVADHSS